MPTTPSRRRGAPSDRVRVAVLGAARDLVAEGGFYGLTVDGLIARSGISKATIYRWWDNRAAVALDMVLDTFGPPAPVPEDEPPLSRLRAYIRSEVAYLAGPAGAVLSGLVGDAQRVPERADTFERRYLGPRRERLRAIVTDALDGDADIVVALIEGAVYHRLLFRQGPLDEAWADRLFDTVTHSQELGRQGPGATPDRGVTPDDDD